MEKHSSHPTLYLDTLEGRLKGDEKIDFYAFWGECCNGYQKKGLLQKSFFLILD